MIDIRQVDEDAVEELAELCSASFVDAYREVHSELDINTYCEKHYATSVISVNLSSPEIIYRVAYRDGNAVGYYMLQTQVCPDYLTGEMVELKQIYMLASEYGTGLGTQLLYEVIRNAQQLNKQWLWLCVSDLNTRAQRFYMKHGFSPLGVAPVLKVGEERLSATVMALEIRN